MFSIVYLVLFITSKKREHNQEAKDVYMLKVKSETYN